MSQTVDEVFDVNIGGEPHKFFMGIAVTDEFGIDPFDGQAINEFAMSGLKSADASARFIVAGLENAAQRLGLENNVVDESVVKATMSRAEISGVLTTAVKLANDSLIETARVATQGDPDEGEQSPEGNAGAVQA